MSGDLRTADGAAVHPLCLGGNVFGWTADEEQSFALLDAYAEAGGNFIDTADEYASWLPDQAGVSERIIGSWMASRANRSSLAVATKVGRMPGLEGLARATIMAAADASLARLGTDYIDLYYAHEDDPDTPLEETLGAFDALVRAGKVRHVGASNYAAPRLAEALAVSAREGLRAFEVLQPQYNLMDRGYEGDLMKVCAAEGVLCVPYFGLAMGFLSGKYRPGAEVESQRARIARRYLDQRGEATLAVLDQVAAAHGVADGAVALAWLRRRPTVGSPVASARTVEQLAEIMPMATLELDEAEIARLDAVATPVADDDRGGVAQ